MTERTTRRNFLVTSAAVAGGIVGSASLQQNASNTATCKVCTKLWDTVHFSALGLEIREFQIKGTANPSCGGRHPARF